MRTVTYHRGSFFDASQTDDKGRLTVFGGQLSPRLDRRVEQQSEIHEWATYQRADFPDLGTIFDRGNA